MSLLSEERRRELHHGLALVLEADEAPAPERLVEHFRHAGEPTRAGHYAARAGDAAREALAFGRAASWYKLSLELGVAGERTQQLLRVRLAEVLENAGHAHEAARHYLEAAEAEPEPEIALDLRRRAAGALLSSGHVEEGQRVLVAVLGAVGLASPSSDGLALAALLYQRARLRLRGLAFEERSASASSSAALLKLDAVSVAAAGYTRRDFVRGSVFASMELRMALDCGEITRVGRALGSEILYAATEGVKQRARGVAGGARGAAA